uniref:Uncharacterized protein n=1 Tax=Arundo donax TaxID=35708 RepID=A0A0A8XYA2_ARUDO
MCQPGKIRSEPLRENSPNGCRGQHALLSSQHAP